MALISWPAAAVLLTSLGSLSLSSYGATASAVTCQGLSATIVSTDGSPATGTPGPDVIVLLQGGSAVAGAGDDVICVRGMAGYVDGGPGDDLVDATTMPMAQVSVFNLGEGADTFWGGPGIDVVNTGPTTSDPATPGPDLERDVVDTGPNGDHVWSGSPGVPNRDSITTGPGDDAVVLAPLSHGGDLDVGGGRNTLFLDVRSPASEAARIDAAARLVTWRDQTVPWSGRFTRIVVNGSPGVPLRLEVQGSSRREIVELDTGREIDARIRLGAGDDTLKVDDRTATGSRYLMGRGSDTVTLNRFVPIGSVPPNPRLRVDLEAHYVEYGEGIRQAEIRGAEVLRVNGVHVTVLGDGHANRVTANGCAVRISGGRGDDFLTRGALASGQNPTECPGTGRLAGGAGRDKLAGNHLTDDVLIGGSGLDVANGKDGFDRCRAEVTHDCEDVG